VTLKPEEDSPAALKAYARTHGVDDPHWLFLTGKPDEVDLLRHKLGFADPNPEVDRDKSRHSAMLRYGNEAMAIWGAARMYVPAPGSLSSSDSGAFRAGRRRPTRACSRQSRQRPGGKLPHRREE
jgi:hypothetical protein